MNTAQRNRAIKALLEREFGKGKVWVRGSRGTAYGWVTVYIDAEVGGQAYSKVTKLIADAGIEIGTYGYNDPGSDYGYGSKINISFYKPYDIRQKDKSNALAHQA